MVEPDTSEFCSSETGMSGRGEPARNSRLLTVRQELHGPGFHIDRPVFDVLKAALPPIRAYSLIRKTGTVAVSKDRFDILIGHANAVRIDRHVRRWPARIAARFLEGVSINTLGIEKQPVHVEYQCVGAQQLRAKDHVQVPENSKAASMEVSQAVRKQYGFNSAASVPIGVVRGVHEVTGRSLGGPVRGLAWRREGPAITRVPG